MKVLIIDSFFSPLGGGQVIAYNTYKLLQKNNIETYYWATDKGPFFETDYKYKKYFTKYSGGTKNYLLHPLKYYSNKEALKDLEKFIDVINPDLIHVHSLINTTGEILKACKDIPTIMTLHNADLICPSGLFLYRNKTICNKQYCKNRKFYNCIKNNCTGNIEKSIRYTILAYNNVDKLKYVNYFITPSKRLKEFFVNANIGIPQNKITVVNNCLFLSEYLNIKPSQNNKRYFLYIGRLSKEKGVHYILQAMSELPSNIELHIVGKGKEEDKLKQYTKRHNLSNVKFLGFKNREEIKNEYKNCIATILPCNWFENFPTTNLESFINGKPVIASNIGGIPEQVENDKTGLLFSPGNVQELKRCILKYWNDTQLVKKHGQNAYLKAVEQYSEDRYLGEILRLYKNAINKMGVI